MSEIWAFETRIQNTKTGTTKCSTASSLKPWRFTGVGESPAVFVVAQQAAETVLELVQVHLRRSDPNHLNQGTQTRRESERGLLLSLHNCRKVWTSSHTFPLNINRRHSNWIWWKSILSYKHRPLLPSPLLRCFHLFPPITNQNIAAKTSCFPATFPVCPPHC